VLVLTDTAGFRHESIADAETAIRALARRSPRYEAQYSNFICGMRAP